MTKVRLIAMVKSYPKSGKSIDYPLTKIKLSILGQGFECTGPPRLLTNTDYYGFNMDILITF